MKFDFFKKKTENKEDKPQKSVAREWADAIIFAVIAATLIRWAFLALTLLACLIGAWFVWFWGRMDDRGAS